MKKSLLFGAALLCSTLMWAEGTVNDTIMASNNGYINEGAPTSKLIQSVWNMEVRTTTKYTRWGYIQIPLEKIDAGAIKVEFKIYLTGENLSTKNADGSLNPNSYTSDDLDGKGIKLSANVLNYTFDSNMTWNTRTMPDGSNEINLGDIELDNSIKDTYLAWDVTSIVKERKAAGENYINIRLESKNSPEMLRIRQVKITTGETGAYYPRLIQTKASVGIFSPNADELEIYPTVVTDIINITEGSFAKVYDIQGRIVKEQAIMNKTLNVSDLSGGLYIIRNDLGAAAKFIKK